MTGGVVVVGGGLAAIRFVEELVARQPDARPTVLADEPDPPYNRILLSAVLEGSHGVDDVVLHTPGWYDAHGVDLRPGARVLGVERDRREVLLVDGGRVRYDRLVLATGAIPTLPPIRGLVRADGTLHPAVHAFRSLADCRRLDAAARTARRAVVVGGGLLGLQVARALTGRGVTTEVVEGAGHLLAGQLGEPGGRVLARHLRSLGTTVYTGTRAVRLEAGGLRLDTGYVLDTELVVLTAGGRPATSLARQAGLMVRRGVVVGDGLQSVTDDRVHAIGDCAEHRGRLGGFVPPAWEQAEVLARRLAGEPEATYRGTRQVARLRATGLDVAVLGDPEHADGEVVELTNPLAGVHRKLVVRDGGLVAATLVGDLSRIGLITRLHENGTVLGPLEPGELVAGEPAAGESPLALDDDVEVCACAAVSAGAIRSCADLAEVRRSTRATTGCGGCVGTVRDLLAAEQPLAPRKHDETVG